MNAIIIFTYLLTTVILISNHVQTYNLDSRKALLKKGGKDSCFGYSVAQHATIETTINGTPTFKSYVLVGAPREVSLSASLTGIKRPGAVYKCDLNQSSKCESIDIDSIVSSNQVNNGNNPASSYMLSSVSASSATNSDRGNPSEFQQPTGLLLAKNMGPGVDRDDQWLGVSVKSQGVNGFALACAHRYVLMGQNFRWGQGICYSLTKNLGLHKIWQPCLNRPVNRAHEEHGYCQVGTSADISNSSDIVLGAPGPYTWRGTVFTNSINFTVKDDRTWYHAPMTDNDAKVDKYSYLGMSVISGKFFNDQEYFVSGAPRARDTMGQVLFMTKQGADDSSRKPLDSTFRTDLILDGYQMASSFGYSLAKMDFNGDNQLDLVVGAPFFFNSTKNQGGAVYLFANDGRIVHLAASLYGKPESRFGFALGNCGDLNKDKFEDLAVGAPYEQPGGVVYIYLGSATGIKPEPAQEIRASNAYQTFGYSLSGGMDMDQNGYPDLVVGSYSDDSVYILRARPIVKIATKIEGDLSKIDPNKNNCDQDKNSLPCFKFSACFELNPWELPEGTRLKYKIVAETFTGQKYSRVKFHDGDMGMAPNVVEKEISIEDYSKRNKLKRCNPIKAYIIDRNDVQSPIQFRLAYELEPPNNSATSSNRYYSSLTSSSSIRYSTSSSSSPSSLQTASQLISASPSQDSTQLPTLYPMLNQEEALRIFSANYLKDCGKNDICESQLELEGSLQLPKETLGINEVGLATDKQVNLTIKVSNNHEPAYEARLFVQHPSNLHYTGFKASKEVVKVYCTPIERNTVKCDLGNPMPRSSSSKLTMTFDTQNQPGTFNFKLMVNTTSVNSKDARDKLELSGTIKRKSEPPTPIRKPPQIVDPNATQDPPGWLILLSVLLGILLFSGLIYCLYVHGFFERSKGPYEQAEVEDSFN